MRRIRRNISHLESTSKRSLRRRRTYTVFSGLRRYREKVLVLDSVHIRQLRPCLNRVTLAQVIPHGALRLLERVFILCLGAYC